MANLKSKMISIEQLFIQTSISYRIAQTDCYQLECALSSDALDQEEKRLAKRILHGVRRGWFSVC